MKTALILASLCLIGWSAEKGTLVKDPSFDFVERVEAVWIQPDQAGGVKIFAIRVGSEAANPIGLFVHAVTGYGPESRSSLWDTGIRCYKVSKMSFEKHQAKITVTQDVFGDDSKLLPSRDVMYQMTGLEATQLCADRPTAPAVVRHDHP